MFQNPHLCLQAGNLTTFLYFGYFSDAATGLTCSPSSGTSAYYRSSGDLMYASNGQCSSLIIILVCSPLPTTLAAITPRTGSTSCTVKQYYNDGNGGTGVYVTGPYGSLATAATCIADGQCATTFCSNGFCAAKLGAGNACTSSNHCASGSCIGGNCCAVASAGNCIACSVTGQCSQCATGYYISGSTCAQQLNAGASCTASPQCLSGNCLGGFCCPANCATCSGSSGLCTTCATGYYRNSFDGTNCYAKRADGGTCTDGSNCLSGTCGGTNCCSSSADALTSANCLSCNAIAWCTSCSSSTLLVYGACVIPSPSVSPSSSAMPSLTPSRTTTQTSSTSVRLSLSGGGTSSSSSSSTSSSDSESVGGAIAGGIVGGVIAVSLVALVVIALIDRSAGRPVRYLAWCSHHSKKPLDSSSPPSETVVISNPIVMRPA